MVSDLEIRGSNPGPGSHFSLENLSRYCIRTSFQMFADAKYMDVR